MIRSAVLIVMCGAAAAHAASMATLYSFTGQSGDGSSPYAAVTTAADGSLYGTTGLGGLYGAGTVYHLIQSGGSWSETVLYAFTGGSDGGYPQSGVIAGTGGVLYGTASGGGTAGMGVVYQLTPPAGGSGPWTQTVLYSFNGPDGAYPYAALTVGPTGSLYGATELGGASGYGAVFRLTPAGGGAWNEAVLYSFTGGTDGAYPYAALASDAKGNLVGTTIFGGASQKGVVYKLTAPGKSSGTWTQSVLHSFTGTDGGFPYGGVIIAADNLIYGTTTGGVTAGYGTVYQLSPPKSERVWTEVVLHTFALNAKGSSPHAALVPGPNGALLGTDLASGSGAGFAGYGVVFQLAPAASMSAWVETVLYTFRGGSDGGDPDAALTPGANGIFYGTTLRGGSAGSGTIFSIQP